jgi:hypothetical protein
MLSASLEQHRFLISCISSLRFQTAHPGTPSIPFDSWDKWEQQGEGFQIHWKSGSYSFPYINISLLSKVAFPGRD